MMLNYNPLDPGRDTWSKNDVGDTTGSPPLTRTAPSWWRGLSLVFALFIGLHAFALGGDKSKATLADAATTCAGAIVLSPTSLPINGQNLVCGSTNDLNSTTAPGLCATGASNSYKGGNEALYSFTPTVTGDYQVSISGQTWTGIFVFQGCPTSGGTCVGSIGSSASSKSINVSLTAGLEYFIWFDTFPSPVSPCAGTFSLISLSAPPACVTATVPTDAATNVARNATLSWTAPAGNATSYDVYFGTDASPAFIGNQTGLTYAPGMLAANTTYYWSVVAKNSFGDATGCLTRSFTTGTQLVYCAATPSSVDGSGITNTQVGTANFPTGSATYVNHTGTPVNVVRGENLDLFVTYATGWAYSTYVWIDLNNDGDFTDSGEMVISGVSAADNPTTLDLSFTPSASIPLGSYRMRIIGGDGIAENPCYSGSYAVARDFVITVVDPLTGAPGCATSLSPADLATNVIRLATLSWNSVFGADAYDLYFGTTPTLTSTELLSADMTATTYTFATALDANTTYYWSVVPKNESGSASDCVVQSFTTGSLSAPYCVPQYSSGKTDGDLISNIEIVGTTLSNNTGTDEVNPAYTYFTGQPNYTAQLQAGSSYQVAVTVGSYGSQNVAVWIDYNDNSIFETSERVGFTTTSIGANGTATFTISLACNPPLGTHRMRIRDVFATAGNVIDPCNSYGFGETEDYDVTITAADACPQPKTFALASTTADGAVVTWAAGCLETAWEVVVQAAGTGTPTGSGVAVSEATYTATGLGVGSYEVYVRANCDTNGFSSWVGPVNFQLLDCPVLNFPADAATGVAVDGGVITFEWDAVANATGYDFMIGTSPTTLALVDTVTELEIPITGFTYNTTYYWSVYPVGSGGTPTACASFSFTTQGPPANDVCSGATSLDSLTSPISGSTVGLANDFTSSCNTTGTAPDAFYSITVPAGYTLVINQVANNYDSVHTVFYGSCAEQTLIVCTDSDLQVTTWTNTTGTTQTVYWVQDGWSTNAGLFELAWTLTPPPVVVSSFSPEAVCGTGGGDTVVITGSNFVNVSSVQFNGIEAASFVVDSSTQITAVVPAGDVAGLISVSSEPSTNGTGSSSAPLTVNEFPAVEPITPAETQSLCVGGQILFATVTPTGLWSSGDETVATVDANGLVTGVGLGNTTIYYTVTLETGCATAVSREVQVYQPIDILSQPSNIAVTTGSPASFSVVATGSVVGATWEVSYDSGFTFEPLTIAPPYSTSFDSMTNTYTLSISSAAEEMSGSYFRLFLDAESPCGDAESFSALLNVGSTGIDVQPAAVTICSPTTSEASFTVVPSGPVDSYLWYVDYGFGPFPITDPVDLFFPEISYSNFDTATLVVSGLTTDHNGLVFSVDVNGPLNTVTSNQAVLTVNGSVEITNQPDSAQTCSSGGSAEFSFDYTGTAAGIQWQYATSAAGPFSPVANGTPSGFTYVSNGSSLTVTNASGTATGVHYYRAVADAASPCIDVITDVASLEVVAPTLVLNTTNVSYCTPGPGVTLSVSGAVNYSWSPATGLDTNEGSTVVASPSTTTTYTVTGTDANGCSSTATVTVNVGPSIDAAASASASLVCEGSSVELSAVGITDFVPTPVNNYVFSTQTGATLDPMIGATTLLGASTDDTASALANIGFNFKYEGNTYSTFSATPDGFLKLGTVTTSQFSNSMTSTTNIPKIAPYWDDMATGTTGSVRYLVTGTAPNRILKVEWFTTIPRNTTGAANSRFQLWLYEAGYAVEMRYGSMGTGSMSATVGLRGAQASPAVYNAVTVSTNTASTTSVSDANSGQPASGRMYRFVPANMPVYTYSWTSEPAGFTSTLANPTVTPVGTVTYNVVVTSSAGCSETASVVVATESGADIVTQPVGSTICQGQPFTLAVEATGPGLTYQWRRNGENILNATSSVYTVAAGLPANSGSYDVVVTPACGPSATSSAVTVTVNPTPTATAPAAVNVCAGTATAAIPLVGTPSGVTFNISGGSAIGLADQTGITQIPSFTPVFGSAVITVTPVANGCTGTPVTFAITVNGVPSALTVTPEASNICSNEPAVMLSATGGIGGRIAPIGTQTSTTGLTGISPFSNGWESQRTQYLIRASELTAAGLTAGDIQGIRFTVTSAGGTLPMINYTVRMAETTATSVASGTFLTPTFTTVYSNPSEPAVTVGQKVISFSTPFTWNGTSNVVIEVCHDNDSVANAGVLYDVTATVGSSTTSFTSVTARYADNNTLCGTNNGTSTSSSNRPHFTFIAANQQFPITWAPVAGLYTDAAATVPYTGTNAAVVYAKPAAGTSTYTATAQAAGCSSADTASVTLGIAQDWYVDADGDGYGDVNLPVAYNGCAQPGYANNNTDCNDSAVGQNPGATEIAFNGIDDDCDGTIDEGSQVFSQVLPTQCGTTVTNIASLVGAVSVPAGTGYRFEVTNTQTNAVQVLDRGVPNFSFTQLASFDYATTYSIRVMVQRNGVWLNYYGTPCLVSTPAVTAPEGAAQVNPSQCGQVLSSINSLIATTSLPGVVQYRFRVTDLTDGDGPNQVQILDRPLHWFSLKMLTRYNYGTTYSVEVAVRTNGSSTFTGFGAPCTVTTPAVPILNQCDQVIATSGTNVSTVSLNSVTQYRFVLTSFVDFSVTTVDRPLNYFRFNDVPNYVPGGEYGVQVAVMTSGQWSPLSDACLITAPSAAREDIKTNAVPFNAVAYPNPFADTFQIELTTSAEANVNVKVFDMTGRMLEQKNVPVSQMQTLQVGERYPAGVYNVIVTQGEHARTLRVIKR